MPEQKSQFVNDNGLSGFPENILTKWPGASYNEDTQKYSFEGDSKQYGAGKIATTEILDGSLILLTIAVPIGLLFWGAKKIAD